MKRSDGGDDQAQTEAAFGSLCERADKPGRHADGEGLYLLVEGGGAKRWVFLFRWKAPGEKGPGKLREMGLGGLSAVSLADAREKAGRHGRFSPTGAPH